MLDKYHPPAIEVLSVRNKNRSLSKATTNGVATPTVINRYGNIDHKVKSPTRNRANGTYQDSKPGGHTFKLHVLG